MTSRLARLAAAAIIALPAAGLAQQPATPAPAVVTPAFDFSGVVFGSYGYRTDSAAKAGLGGQNPNQFGLDRAYLTFRMPAGDNGQVRVTTDVFQNTNSTQNGFYQGWAIRIKYAYLQYTGLKNEFGTGSSLTGRIGVLHTVVIDHQEQFWPRYLGQTAVERNGFFSSADAGAAGLVTLGNKMGEIYGTITNGPGYTSYETDRFKDFAVRASLTPFANSADANAIVKTFAITPWYYKGFRAGTIGSALQRDRFGIFTGVRERRLSAGLEYAQRMDESDRGANTAASPRVVTDSSGRLFDGFIVARLLELFGASAKSNFGVVARFDHFTPNVSPTTATAGPAPSYNFSVLGASWDLNQKITLALDWQKQTGTNSRAIAPTSSIFLHFQASF
jgi:hypothetical protein